MKFDKSMIFFSANMDEVVRLQVSAELGVRISMNLEKYLGLPDMVGRKKKVSFQSLKDRLKRKVNS